MKFRPWAVAALCLGTLPAWTPTAPPAAPQRYRLEVKTKIVQDLTAMGQGQQTQEYSNVGYVTLTAKDSGDGQAVTVVFDSLQMGAGAPLTPEQVKGVAGATWHGYRGANGRVADLVLVGDNQVAQSVEGLLTQLFPPLRKGASIGQSWTDTTDAEALLGVTARTVTNLVTSNETVAGAKVVKLAGASASAISGTIQSPQGQVAIEGTGTGTIAWLIGPDGGLISCTGSSAQNMTVSIAVAPEPIPVAIEVQSTTTLIQ